MGILRTLFRGERQNVSRSTENLEDRSRSTNDERAAGHGILAHAAELSADGRFADALKLVTDAIAEYPSDAHLRWARADVLFRWERNLEAAAEYKAAAELGNPYSSSQLINRGWADTYSGNPAAGRKSMERALATDPSAEAHFALGYVLHLLKEWSSSLAHLDRSLELDPKRLQACIVAGAVHLILKEPEAAERYYQRAIEIEPGSASAWSNLAVAQELLDRDDEALPAFAEAARLESATGEWVGALTNYAIAVGQSGRVDDAIKIMASEERPPRPYRQYVRGLTLISVGRWTEGWPFHEFRWACEPLVGDRPNLTMPRWYGQNLNGRRIVIRGEQGYGDMLQFLRYAPWLKRLGATVYLRVQQGFESAGLGFEGVDKILVGAEHVEADFYIPCMSLPSVFGTSPETVPLPIPYVHVAPDVAERWSLRLPRTGKLRVGLVWAGNPDHHRDRHRSIPLAAFAPVIAIPGVAFYSLQKGNAEADIAALNFTDRLENLAPELVSYGDTAAAIQQLDLIICVDTSVAHLAGALGCPTWILVQSPPEWRWMLDRADSPWYPSARLFRQRERRQWAPVIQEVAQALAAFAGEHRDKRGSTWQCNLVTPPMEADPPPLAPPLNQGVTGTTLLAETRYGLLEYLPDEPGVGRSIAYCGEYLQLLVVHILRFLPAGSTVVEVGAGVGAHTLGLATQVSDTGHVIAFEHRPRHRQALQQNLTYNRLRNVTLMKRPPRGAEGTVGSRPTDSIDDLNLDSLACVMIGDGVIVDEVLVGAEATLWRLRPMLCTPVKGAEALLVERMKGFGYRVWRVESPLFNPANFNRWNDDVFGGRIASTLIGIPEEMDSSIGGNWVALD